MKIRQERVAIVACVTFAVIVMVVLLGWAGWCKKEEMRIAESLSAFVTAWVILLGGIFACYKWDQDQKTRRAELLKSLITQFSDPRLQVLCALCASDMSQNIEDKIIAHEEDCKSTFVFFSYLCYALRVGLIDERQFGFFEFHISNVVKNRDAWKYLMDFTEAKDPESPTGPYSELIKESERRGWISGDDCQDVISDGTPSDSGRGGFVEKDSFKYPTIVIRVNRLYRPGMTPKDLYEVTRGNWRVNYNVVKRAKFALSVARQTVQEVYRIEGWETPAGVRIADDSCDFSFGRIRFVGNQADAAVRDEFIGKSTTHLFRQGDAYPVRYFSF